MKAVEINGKSYKIAKELGAYVYYIDGKGKIKCSLASDVKVIESEEVVKEEVKIKAKKLNPANFMKPEEYANSRIGRMTQEEAEEYRRRKVEGDMMSSLRRD